MNTSSIKNVPSNASVKLIANIHWYCDARNTSTSTRTKASQVEENVYKLSRKWKYDPGSLQNEEYAELVRRLGLTQNVDY